MEKSWLVLALFLVSGFASATTVAPRRCSPDTRALEWARPSFPTTINQRMVRSVVVYVAINTEGLATFAAVIELELDPTGRSDSSEAFDKALAAAVGSWRFPRQPSRCVMELRLPLQVSGERPGNSFKPTVQSLLDRAAA